MLLCLPSELLAEISRNKFDIILANWIKWHHISSKIWITLEYIAEISNCL